ncbi:helix-turn-helix transcriptional regulator [Noviherbaspirillum sp. DKR-6]|uniref:Helix-turn-helix transcriptional regulator n=1 Tax=Noviherbaspirillum pedocola TaxID=2801341 RepID=A0A934W7D7_9BURK|nr:helix-turn-helix transcriptional regulator [Noviherbaspirillum pedocola]
MPVCFGRVLRKLRKDAQLTQEALGMKADLQRNYVSSIELGEKQPSLTSIFKLGSALNIKPGMLLDLVEKELTNQSGGAF